MRIEVDMRGLTDAFSRAPQVFYREINRSIKEGLVDIKRDAMQHHRFHAQSNNLARSVQVDFTDAHAGNGLRLDTGIAPYAGYVHDGTKPHKIYPKNAKALVFFKGGKKVVVLKNPHKLPGFIHEGGRGGDSNTIFSNKGYVNHPGAKPDPFLYEAAERGTKGLINRIAEGIGRAIESLGLKGK